MRLAKIIVAATLALSGLAACDPATDAPAPSSGHNREQAAPPDPAPRAPTPSDDLSIRFKVVTDIEVVVTYNSGHGNKFIDSVKPPGESWVRAAPRGAAIYLSATPAKRGERGTIGIIVDNAITGKGICRDNNFTNKGAGASCGGPAR